MPHYERKAVETLDMHVVATRRCSWRYTERERVTLTLRTSVPGGTSGYPYDRKPYDRRIVLERLGRLVRMET